MPPTDEETTAPEAVPEKVVPVQESEGPPLASTESAAAAETVADDGASDTGSHESAGEPELTPEQKRLKQAEWNAKQNRYEASQAKKRASELEAELAALKAERGAAPAERPTAADTAAVEANAPAGGFRTAEEFNAAVQREADARAARDRQAAAQRSFDEACNITFNKGVEDYKDDFRQAVANLQSVGVMSRDVLDLVLATDDPAKVLFDLGSDPDKAQALMEMTPAKRAVEIAKLSVTPTKKSADPLSRAPAPIRPVEGTARVSGDPRDDDDDAAWFAKRQAQRAERMMRA